MTQLLDLGKLRFNFTGDWLSTRIYEVNDVVKHGGNNYVYIYGLKTSGNHPTDTTYWALLSRGFAYRGIYDNATAYKIADGVAYGGNLYVALQDSTGNLPSNATYWEVFFDGIKFEGPYNSATAYALNDVVNYGGSLYRALGNTTNNVPTNTTYWQVYQAGVKPLGNWLTGTIYYPNDLVVYGANNFLCLTAHTSGTFATDLAATKWQKYNSGVRWRSLWVTATSYLVDDIVYNGPSSYICRADHTSAAAFATDLAANKWELFAEGGDYVLPATTNNVGKYVSTDGTNYVWANGETNWSEKTANYTASVNERLFLNSSGGAFTVTLPASPSVGDFVELCDSGGKLGDNNVTLARNGLKIVGLSEDLVLDKSNIGFKLVYTGTTNGWRLN